MPDPYAILAMESRNPAPGRPYAMPSACVLSDLLGERDARSVRAGVLCRPVPSPSCFTGIEGSTGLLLRLGEAYARALGEHQALLRAALAQRAGAEVDTQCDAFFVAFPTAPAPVAVASDATHALAARAWRKGQRCGCAWGRTLARPASRRPLRRAGPAPGRTHRRRRRA